MFRFIEVLIFCLPLPAAFLSCAGAPKGTVGKNVQYAAPESDGGEMTSLPAVPRKNQGKTFFSHIDGGIMADMEAGSPASLRRAAAAIRRSDSDSEMAERVLLAVAYRIMKIVWPSERVDWDAPDVPANTPYMGAINSAQNGIYDTSTGNIDFLALVLPSLVVVVSDSVGGFFDASEQALREGLGMRPGSVLVNYLLGTLYQKNGMPAEALPFFSAAAGAAPECLETAYSYAVCLASLGRMEEARRAAAALSSRHPSDLAVLKLCAETSFALGDYNAAEEYIARVLQQEPGDLPSVLFRVRILMEKKEYVRAASLLDVYARQDDSSRDYLLLRAQIQYDWSKNLTAAVSTIETALRRFPDDLEVLLFAARLASDSGTSVAGRTVEEYAEAALAVQPESARALQYAVEGLVQNGEWQEAYAASSNLLSKDGASLDAVFRHIRICLALGRNDEAWNLISPIYRTNPQDEEVVQSYIVTMAETGRRQQALSLINQLLPDASSRMKSFLYYRRSFLQASEGDALSDLRSSLIANPRNSDALFRLYELYFQKRDYRKAQYYLKQVVALNPNDAAMRRLNDELSSLIQ
ncbi:MAG: tetratricopeptide repeat protein [Treponemataceae bacterium]|nr:tetratricopeptide repeat protein [Treponemataceae bacterium]